MKYLRLDHVEYSWAFDMYGILTLCDVDGGFLGTNYKILYTFLSHTRFTAENFSFCAVISGSAAVVSRSAANIVQFCC